MSEESARESTFIFKSNVSHRKRGDSITPWSHWDDEFHGIFVERRPSKASEKILDISANILMAFRTITASLARALTKSSESPRNDVVGSPPRPLCACIPDSRDMPKA